MSDHDPDYRLPLAVALQLMIVISLAGWGVLVGLFVLAARALGAP